MDGISGRVAVITGSASGIGVGLARNFIAKGSKVVCVDIQESGRQLIADHPDESVFVQAGSSERL